MTFFAGGLAEVVLVFTSSLDANCRQLAFCQMERAQCNRKFITVGSLQLEEKVLLSAGIEHPISQ